MYEYHQRKLEVLLSYLTEKGIFKFSYAEEIPTHQSGEKFTSGEYQKQPRNVKKARNIIENNHDRNKIRKR